MPRILLALISPFLMALLALVNPIIFLVLGVIGILLGQVKVNDEKLPWLKGLLVGPFLVAFGVVFAFVAYVVMIVLAPIVVLTSQNLKVTVGSKVYYL